MTEYFSSDTPYSNGSRTRVGQSLGGEFGRQKLPQCRVNFVADMAHSAVLTEKEEFCNDFFPSPPPLKSTQKPRFTSNPFSALAGANSMLEADVRSKFVSVPVVVVRSWAQSSLVADQCYQQT